MRDVSAVNGDVPVVDFVHFEVGEVSDLQTEIATRRWDELRFDSFTPEKGGVSAPLL